MVSLNLIQYREEVKRALLARKNELDQEWDPFVASWLAYAFLCEGSASFLLAQEMFERLQAWAQEESAWQFRRNISPLLFLVWLQSKFGYAPDKAFFEKVLNMFLELNPDNRFSPLRYPEQVFLMAFGISSLKRRRKAKNHFVNVVGSQTKGGLTRQILFAAALKEVGGKHALQLSQPLDATDVLAMLWWAEKYNEVTDKNHCWLQFESIEPTLLLYKTDEFDTRRVLSEWELALLYEALIRETSRPDPAMLFDYYPLHDRVKQIAERDFKAGNYFSAVFETCKALEDYLRKISGYTRIGVNLAEDVLGKPDMSPRTFSEPRVKLNPLDTKSTDFVSQLDEQKGFSSLTIGIFQAFRNPKGHQPKDKTWVEIDAYEAIDQLVVISLVMKRLQDATGVAP
ncbi:TIGR02391 family protein [Thermanaerothrix daxensis]|uniref:TIGR02391 family protein n=1 Tax=Thermanaerothrix daxensis TaxID=869279 RepID=UPI0006C930E8|nr:TIGR02391 family protein [Thermanaerothrix daxensis]